MTTQASWLITFLGGYPEWCAKATAEVSALLASCSPSPPPPTRSQSESEKSSEAASTSISANLATIPLEVWETQTPVLDSIIRETLRLAQSHAALRRNLGPEVHIDGKVVPTGAYVVYPFSDVHLDPDLYPDPWRFDPSRVEPKTAFGYVGWGGGKFLLFFVASEERMNARTFFCFVSTGRTVCLGTRLAKLELKLVTAMFLLGFRHRLVDRAGKPVDQVPQPNWNDLFLCRPLGGSCHVNYKRTDTVL
jgi:cytochrome P450